jgi:hypothetical protein
MISGSCPLHANSRDSTRLKCVCRGGSGVRFFGTLLAIELRQSECSTFFDHVPPQASFVRVGRI